jgi:hypothetical protein
MWRRDEPLIHAISIAPRSSSHRPRPYIFLLLYVNMAQSLENVAGSGYNGPSMKALVEAWERAGITLPFFRIMTAVGARESTDSVLIIFTEPLNKDMLSHYGVEVVQVGSEEQNNDTKFAERVITRDAYLRLLGLQKHSLTMFRKSPVSSTKMETP